MLHRQIAQKAIDRANFIIKTSQKFKIGKTGQTTKARFNSDYRTYFEKIERIYRSKDKSLVNDLESTLTTFFKGHPKNFNLKEGNAGKMTDENGYYILYIVFTPDKSIIETILDRFRKN